MGNCYGPMDQAQHNLYHSRILNIMGLSKPSHTVYHYQDQLLPLCPVNVETMVNGPAQRNLNSEFIALDWIISHKYPINILSSIEVAFNNLGSQLTQLYYFAHLDLRLQRIVMGFMYRTQNLLMTL